ncbi:D-alanyl-D-alanine carboxypeptidase/D-alanyl-D-alanine endopeptidase [Paeniglutamicibacter cryotolerans]|uniref:D-alanyl-D-alanine carboxypeptidase/D-alanyl-D-alanine-endopeptidase (Penicillin-binding protein 4) n=1 Tax=Paeniglutamicibacter cryotolerans TaxID=670079 RepID=A0A839QKB8_9MICC|nr:D-alanyl-D-alanine carboxypeptidase/D-alanyl-D-alanine-endopeptidase [Paeniglutamicibacter cryotolerans]MBB2995005.1 D-alanyl-D-alanine carboxypeptidase/D-alanyl-D-alanine-endopeptidase (penicillin-binding protein 4) [Paeniglutamicibacter cryotolerans]
MKKFPRGLAAVLAVVAIGTVLGLLALNLIPVWFAPAPAPDPAPIARPEIAVAKPTALPHLEPDAPAPDPARLKALLDQVLRKPDGTSFSATVIDVLDGATLYEHGGDRPGIPASSLKILTAVAATTELGLEKTFDTSVVMPDAGTLVLVGGGDVLLGTGESRPESTVGHAGVGTLAKKVAAKLTEAHATGGIDDTLKLVLDDSLFTGPGLNPAWDQSLMDTSNISAVQPLALYGARRDAGPSSTRVDDPAMTAAQAFADALRSELAATTGAPQLAAGITRGQSDAGDTTLASVSSAPLGDTLSFMLQVSDNYVAEVMGRLVAIKADEPGSYTGGANAVRRSIGRLGIDITGMELVDTSGLAATNRVAPRQLAQTLVLAATSGVPALRELSYQLPLAGATGTLSHRLGATSTRGLVRAKTGSLLEVSSLSGLVVADDGRLLAFSVFAKSPQQVIAPHKDVLDSFATVLAGCGCR